MVRALHASGSEHAVLYVNLGGLTNVAVANDTGCLFTRAASGGLDAMLQTLCERRGLTVEHARGWMQHVGLVTPIDQVEGEAELVAFIRQTLEDGVHTIADTVRNSLNFYRMQESAETRRSRGAHRARGGDPRLHRAPLRAAADPGRGLDRGRPGRGHRPRPPDGRRRARGRNDAVAQGAAS